MALIIEKPCNNLQCSCCDDIYYIKSVLINKSSKKFTLKKGKTLHNLSTDKNMFAHHLIYGDDNIEYKKKQGQQKEE